MRWIRFSHQGHRAYGILEGDRLREVAGDPFQGWEATAKSHALAAVKIEVPVLPVWIGAMCEVTQAEWSPWTIRVITGLARWLASTRRTIRS